MNSAQLLFDIINFKRNKELSLSQTQATLNAFVDAIISRDSEKDIYSEDYLISMLDHLLSVAIVKKNIHIPMANITAEMLNIAAKELIDREENERPINPYIVQEKGVFAALDPSDRFRTISLLEELRVDLSNLPIPFWKNSGIVLAIISVLTLLTTFGYYSEWSAYDSTRLDLPDERILEEFPTSWEEVGYPGPSKGYHALRGYLK